MEYKCYCEKCDGYYEDIVNFYCIKNRKKCEKCLALQTNVKQYKRRYKKIDVDQFKKYRSKNYMKSKSMI